LAFNEEELLNKKEDIMLEKSYPIYFLYCTKNLDRNQLLFKPLAKGEWIKELINPNSNLFLFLKEDVRELFYKTGGYLTYLDFDSVYKLAVEVTKNQAEKSIRKNKKIFFENEFNDNYISYTKIKQRLTNNLRNMYDSKRKINVLNIDLWIIDKIYENYEIDTTIWDLQKLLKINPQLIIENIIKLANTFEITTYEIEELGEKLNLDLSTISELNLSLEFRNLRKDVNNQAFFVFEIEDFGEVA
jgi:hypothetical protein